MRELTKSMLGFSLAMPLFGMRQMMAIALPRDPSRPFGKATDSFDAVTGATAGQMDGAWKDAFQAGDRLQRGVVDLMLGVLSGDSLDLNRMMRMTSGMLQTSLGAVGRGLGDCGCCGGGAAKAAAGGATPGEGPAKWGGGRGKAASSPYDASPADAASSPYAASSPDAAGAPGSVGSQEPVGSQGSAGSQEPSTAAPSDAAGAALRPPPGWTVSVPNV